MVFELLWRCIRPRPKPIVRLFTWVMNPSSAARSNISAGSLDIHLKWRWPHASRRRNIPTFHNTMPRLSTRLSGGLQRPLYKRVQQSTSAKHALPNLWPEQHDDVGPQSLLWNIGISEMSSLCRQQSLPANKSMIVSSRAEDAIAPALVAPIALQMASATWSPFPEPSCSTETKHGKPFPFSYKERTDDPIILSCRLRPWTRFK